MFFVEKRKELFVLVKKTGLVFFLTLINIVPVQAAMVPKNGAVLNHTQVMFEYDQVKDASKYMVIIQQVNSRPETKPIIIANTSLACMITEGLQFGAEYTWKVEAWRGNKKIHTTPDQQFSTSGSLKIDSSYVKFHIQTAEKNAFENNLLLIDHLGIIINRKGQPVWYFPEEYLGVSNDQFNFRAMNITKSGTVTFIYNSRAYEYALDGFPLWEAPVNTVISGAAVESYHHDFKKLPDGTYLACGYHFNYEPNYLNENIQSRVRYNTLLRFDREGKLLWYWNEKDHVDKSVVFRNYSSEETEIAGTHLNGFDVNFADSSMVLSFRNTSEVLKIDMRQSGKVVHTWQGTYSPKFKNKEYIFSSQHGPFVTPEGNIVIYNNNIQNDRDNKKAHYPKILIVSNPGKANPSVKLWEYECAWNKKPLGIQAKEGYAVTLPNKNILVNTGGAERTFEVNPAKKVVWDCSYEKKDTATFLWKPFANYRCAYTSSLYPAYFTLETIFVKELQATGQFKINNEGTENDRYEIEVADGLRKILYQKKVSIKSRTSSLINIRQYLPKNTFQPVTIKVWPEGRPELGRILL
jgi:Arylsulfotransferase (ASST)